VKVRAHVTISGTVQGVNFRFYTKQMANLLGINGWVKNLDSGEVEAVFEGSKDVVDEIIGWCKIGPTSAKVDDVDVTFEEVEGLNGFRIL
jgi:acylphosphatase